MGQYMRGSVAQVGQHAQFAVAVTATELQRLPRIVGHSEWGDLQLAQVNRRTILCEMQHSLKVAFARRKVGSIAHPHGCAMAQRPVAREANMVAVFVRDENSVNLRWGKPGVAQSFEQHLGLESAINQQALYVYATACFNDCGIARAAAAQTSESH